MAELKINASVYNSFAIVSNYCTLVRGVRGDVSVRVVRGGGWVCSGGGRVVNLSEDGRESDEGMSERSVKVRGDLVMVSDEGSVWRC